MKEPPRTARLTGWNSKPAVSRRLSGMRAPGTIPLLVMDMWEHAYYLQYRNKKEKWIVAFWELVNWGDVARRLDNAVCADLALDADYPRVVRTAGGSGRPGRVTLRTRAIRQVTLLRQRHRLALELQVTDEGPGVPEDIREKIFNPLVSGRDGGSGLGLSLAQTFVHYHRGVIECDSRPGRTVFRIVLPLA